MTTMNWRLAMWTSVLLPALASAGQPQSPQLAYEPVALGWSADEVTESAASTLSALMKQAAAKRELGCLRECDRLNRLFTRLLAVARQQTSRAQSLPWRLVIVRTKNIVAMALPGGSVVVSESFVEQHRLSDEALAFVLAHEMAHVILEHERQALTFARMLLPRQVPRSVADMYTEMDFDLGLVKAMEPVLQQGEVEADELGLLLASWAGFKPERQLSFLAGECAGPAPTRAVVQTHPPNCVRLRQLRERLPLAIRLWSRQHTIRQAAHPQLNNPGAASGPNASSW